MKDTSHSKKNLPVILRFLRVVIILLIAIGLAKLLISMRKPPEKKAVILQPPSVKVMTVQPVPVTMRVEAFGTVKPGKLLKIAAEVQGRIDYIHPGFIEGGRIRKGEEIIKIDPRSYRLSQEAARVKVSQARTDIKKFKQDIDNLKKDISLTTASLELAKKEFKRIQALTLNKFASKNNLDQAEQQYIQAQIQSQNLNNQLLLTDTLMEQKRQILAMAKIEYGQADLAMEKSIITAEFDGFVLSKSVEAGEFINPGQVMGSMYQSNDFDVDIRIPLEDLKWVGDILEGNGTFKADVSPANDEGSAPTGWEGRVKYIKAKIDETTRTLPITLDILPHASGSGDHAPIKPGLFVKCSIRGKTFENIFVLPRSVLKRNHMLYTVDNGHLKIKPVHIVRRYQDNVYIDQGLSPDDHIIISPLPGAIEGMALTIKQDAQ